MAAQNETVLLELPCTKRKKQDGTLYLSDSRIFWVDESTQEHKVNIHYSQVKMQRISPDGVAKVQLQLILHNNGPSTNFHFTGREPVADRTKAKDLLQKLLTKFKSKPSSELENKSRLLSSDPALHQLYKDLVTGGVISAEEFWAQHSDSIVNSGAIKDQLTGIPSAFLADVRAEMDSVNKIKFNLTADAIDSLFRTYPAVKAKHDKLVPEKMTDREFWTHFFQASHFHRTRSSQPPPSSYVDLYSECMDQEAQVLQKPSPGAVELFEEGHLEGYGVGSGHPGGAISKDLVKRCNLHSSMVLKALQAEPTARCELREKVSLLDELSLEQPLSLPLLETTGQNTSAQETKPSTAFRAMLADLAHWRPNLAQVMSTQSAEAAIARLSPGGAESLVHSTHGNIQVSEAVLSRLQKCYSTLNELLRHFWACFPVTTPQAQDKLTRMAGAIQKLQISRNELDVDQELLTHLLDLRDSALSRYHLWSERRARMGPLS